MVNDVCKITIGRFVRLFYSAGEFLTIASFAIARIVPGGRASSLLSPDVIEGLKSTRFGCIPSLGLSAATKKGAREWMPDSHFFREIRSAESASTGLENRKP